MSAFETDFRLELILAYLSFTMFATIMTLGIFNLGMRNEQMTWVKTELYNEVLGINDLEY